MFSYKIINKIYTWNFHCVVNKVAQIMYDASYGRNCDWSKPITQKCIDTASFFFLFPNPFINAQF